ncbi:MAG: hypothetical protein RSC87_01520 [Muribaculaceae bacterium]
MKKITHLLFLCFALFAFTANAGSGIFIRGGVNNWGTPADWEFADKGNGVYTIENKELKGAFKIADATWSDACNYGGNGVDIVAGTSYELKLKSNANINVAGTIKCTKITFTKLADKATLLLEGTESGGGEIKQVYVMGDNNKWIFTDESGKLSPIEGETKVFTGTVTFPAGPELSFWRIYEDLGQVGSWGSESGENTKESTITGTLKKGSEGCITTVPGTYAITFDISTGMFDLEKKSGVDGVEMEAAKVIGGDGNITVLGNPQSVLIYTTSGALISSKSSTVDVASGLYIVVVDNKVTKVIVK